MVRLLALALLTGCYLKHYPVTPNVADAATYKVTLNGGSGTAWAINSHHLITAGHVCNHIETTITVVSGTRRFHARPIVWEYSEYSGISDLCLLRTDVELPSWLIIAKKMPRVGDDVFYVGYPMGRHLVSSGKYLGDLDGDRDWNNDVFSAPTDRGASGSALSTREGVWGVLVRLRTDGGEVRSGSEGGAAVDLEQLRRFLDENDVSYDSTPEPPPALPPLNPGGLPITPAPHLE